MLHPLESYCLSKPGAEADYPFGPEVRVFKVAGKMFALCSSDRTSLSLKCDPAWAEVLRQHHAAVTPGYHLNKRHWNSIALDGTVTEVELRNWIDHSYALVVASLPKAVRTALATSTGA